MTKKHSAVTKKWQLAHGRSLELGGRAMIMGILNVTPDSFSDGGLHLDVSTALDMARKMIADGADIIDIGGESTRPGAVPVDAATEQARILPVIRALSHETDCVISVDTYRAETAGLAVDAGAHIVNDVWGLQREPDIARLAHKTGAGLVIMHTGRERERHPDVIADQTTFLATSLKIAEKAGVNKDQIVLDPGFGFAKDLPDDVALMARFKELLGLGFPFLVGTSRKRFIGGLTGQADPMMRDVGTAATSVALRLAGADIVRVHNVAFNKDALAIADAILQSSPERTEG